MFTITKLKMWKDPGYTRQCVEVPPLGSKKLPIPDYVSTEDLRPRKGALLNAVELPLSYIAVHDMSYLYMEVKDGQETPNTMSIFGWILSVEETASSNEAVVIRWTPDYWRTYSASATFGKGTVTRCANASYKRPFLTEPRKWVRKSEISNIMNRNQSLNFIMMVSESDSNGVTGFSYYYGDVDGPVDSVNHTRTFTTSEMFSGRIDELIHDPNNDPILPTSIIGAWIIPTPNINLLFTDFQTLTTTTGLPSYTITYYRSRNLNQNAVTTNLAITGLAGYGSDDMKRCVSVDPYGHVTSMLPWGYSFSTGNVDLTLDISAEGVTIYYCDHAVGLEKAMEEGCYLMFTGLPIPINSNAWSEYAYSYQRSYDKRMAEIQRNQRAVSGISSVGTSMVGGAIAGATKGNAGGAIGGAVAGGALSLIGSIADYVSSPYFNDEIQRETDKLVSNQTSNVLIGGGGIAWKNLASYWKIIQLEADSVSLAEYTAKVTNDGYTVEIPVGTPTAFMTAGGPLQIQELMVTGSIPPEAKTYIKTILSNGVRIVENNPSGVVP